MIEGDEVYAVLYLLWHEFHERRLSVVDALPDALALAEALLDLGLLVLQLLQVLCASATYRCQSIIMSS